MHPKTDGILESSLYVSDVARSVRFYEEIFGFRVIKDFGERGCAMDAGARHVLLLFKKGGSRGDYFASRWGRRTAHSVRNFDFRIGQMGAMARRERNCVGGETSVGRGRHEPLFSRPGSPFARSRHAGHMVDLLRIRLAVAGVLRRDCEVDPGARPGKPGRQTAASKPNKLPHSTEAPVRTRRVADK